MIVFVLQWPSHSQQDALFHFIAYDYSCADWASLCDHLRDVSLEDIFKLSASAAAAHEFSEWVQVVIDVYISHQSIRSGLTHLHGFQLLVLLISLELTDTYYL